MFRSDGDDAEGEDIYLAAHDDFANGAGFIEAYTFSSRLPYEFICKKWTSGPD